MPPVRLYSPTGRAPRGWDDYGSGAFGANRSKKDATGKVTRYRHKGVDFTCQPGQFITAPCSGIVSRHVQCYPGDPFWRGIELDTGWGLVKLLYCVPSAPVDSRVVDGEYIATAQDISTRYPGITPHVHMEVTLKDTSLIGNCANPGLWLVGAVGDGDE